MPGKAACSKLKGKAKADCLAYKGKYAKKAKGNPIDEMSRVKSAKGGYQNGFNTIKLGIYRNWYSYNR